MRAFVVVGTRPEAIKMAPVYSALKATVGVEAILVSTGQHRQMLDQVFSWFNLRADEDLDLMQPGQTVASVISKAVAGLDSLIERRCPDCVLGQGDTTTVMAAALAAFARGVPFGHVEAGLRTYDLDHPYPEEGFRQMVSRVTRWHFAPTARAADCVAVERAGGEVYVVGNTVIDALLQTAATTAALPRDLSLSRPRTVLITGHRRENFGKRFDDAFGAISDLAGIFADVDFVYPVHLNPNVRSAAHAILRGKPNVHLIDPLPYPEIVALMKRSALILTDSGGIQEEAPSLKTPVLVMRDTTERQEAIEAGAARLVGAERATIVAEASRLLSRESERQKMIVARNPFGDGDSAGKIARILRAAFPQ